MNLLSLQLSAIRHQAKGIHSFEFRRPDGGRLPAFSAGAHIDLHLQNGMVRSYSLCNAQIDSHRYVIAINRDRDSRGGSTFAQDQLKVGEIVTIGGPRNNFALTEDASHTVMIGGGIGITPLWCMTQRLDSLERSWELHYCARSQDSAAFLAELQALRADSRHGQLHLYFGDQTQKGRLDIPALVAATPPGTHFYCCGPAPMLADFERAAGQLPPPLTHVEHFAAKEQSCTTGGFRVKLARSGRILDIGPGETVLDALLNAGVEVPYSCKEGICASCETQVLAGIPDHRDGVLTNEEKEANTVMMVCCSGSRSPLLVLDR